MRPLIGIPCHADHRQGSGRPVYCNNRAYTHAVESAGGIPVLIPMLHDTGAMDALLVRLDGILFSGGVDVQPHLYNDEPHPMLGGVDPELDEIELALIQRALQEDMPILGICRGMQLLNVALGGTLYQDLHSQLPNSFEHCRRELPRNTPVHDIYVEPDSKWSQILGKRQLRVNSLHHQAVKTPGKGVRITGYAEDGVAELMEVPGHRFLLAAQCHPEELYTQEVACANLFAAFVKACSSLHMLEDEEVAHEDVHMKVARESTVAVEEIVKMTA